MLSMISPYQSLRNALNMTDLLKQFYLISNSQNIYTLTYTPSMRHKCTIYIYNITNECINKCTLAQYELHVYTYTNV